MLIGSPQDHQAVASGECFSLPVILDSTMEVESPTLERIMRNVDQHSIENVEVHDLE
ncbi:hypothetical protein Dimus_002879 [Dionaea muscipula]